MDQKTTTYAPRTRHWHKLLLCVGLVAALGVEECEFDLGFVSIDSPQAKTFTEAQTVTITATARSGEGLTVVGVDFYRNGRKMGTTDFTPPYTHNWPITAADSDQGPHRWHAEAAYQVGSTGEERLKSDEVVYEVGIDDAPPLGTGVIGSVEGVRSPVDIQFDPDSGIAIVRSQSGLAIFDVADPTRPRLASRVDLEGEERGVAVKGDLAFVVVVDAQGSDLVVLDVTDPRNPVSVARMPLPGEGVGDIAIQGSLAYVGNAGGLHLVDVEKPHAPRFIRTAASDAVLGGGVEIADGFIVVRSKGGTAWFEASDPRNPVFVAEAGIHGDLAYVGRTVFVATGKAFVVLDFSDLYRVRRIDVLGWPGMKSVTALDGMLYGPSPQGVGVFDPSDPADIRLVEEFPLPAEGYLVASGSNLVVVIDRSSTFSVIATGR